MTINLNEAQMMRKELVLDCISGKKTTRQAAIEAGFTIRTIQKNIQDYKKRGDAVFVHGNIGKKRYSPENIRRTEQVIDVFQNTRLEGLNPFENISYTYFTEILNENFNIKISRTKVKGILNSLNYQTPIKHNGKKNKSSHFFRELKEHFGELVQADGTP